MFEKDVKELKSLDLLTVELGYGYGDEEKAEAVTERVLALRGRDLRSVELTGGMIADHLSRYAIGPRHELAILSLAVEEMLRSSALYEPHSKYFEPEAAMEWHTVARYMYQRLGWDDKPITITIKPIRGLEGALEEASLPPRP